MATADDGAAAMRPEYSTVEQIDENARRGFETAWSGGHAPAIEDFLPPADDPRYLPTLEELVRIDLEMLWKGRAPDADTVPMRVESYLVRFPPLNDPAIVLQLLRQEYRTRHKYGDRPSADEYRGRFPALVGSGATVETEVPQAPALPGAVAAPRIPGYEILEPLGQGAMGVVHKARHAALNRVVALKTIRGPGTHDEAARFRIEAEVVARLHHPNIVEVYEIGTADERPYLSLEYVPGGTLGQFIGTTVQPARLAAATVERLARAIHAAHLAGILHRDLKPGNVLLAPPVPGTESDASGPALPWTPKIADFGLAKRVGDTSEQTATGAVIGTPCYMAPEQAAARKDIDRRADIYALGAVLYHMLTGRPPFKAATTWDTLAQVMHQEPLPPSRTGPRVPRDLETICLKCLRKDPEGRYATAEELADELRRFLRDEPIRARPVGRLERAWRWCRREKKLAIPAAIVIAVVVLGAGLGAHFWLRLEREAATRLDADIRDIDGELSFIDREEFTLSPQMDETRRLFLEKLADKAEQLTAQESRNPILQRKKAEVHLRLGTIYQLLGRYASAESAYTRAIDVLTSPGADPAGSEALARSAHQLANLLNTVGQFDAAEARFRQAVEILTREGAGAEARPVLAETQHDFGKQQVMTGQLDAGEENYRRALALQRQIADGSPDTPKDQLTLAAIETSLGNYLVDLSRFDDAAPLLDAAVRRQEKLTEAAPGVPIYRQGLARTLIGRAVLHDVFDRKRENYADTVRAYELWKRLAGDYPHRPDYRLELSNVRHRLARVISYGPAIPDANLSIAEMEQSYRDAIAQQERLVAEFPAVIAYRQELALSLGTCATWLCDKSTISSTEPRISRRDESAEVQARIAVYAVSAALRVALLQESEETHRRAEAIWKRLVAEHPTVIAFQNGLGASHQRYGIVLEHLTRYDEAATRYREAIAVHEQLAQKYPKIAKQHQVLGSLHNNLGVIADRRNDLPEAERQFRKAVASLQAARALAPLFLVYRDTLTTCTANVAEILFRTGRYQEAAPLIHEIPGYHLPFVAGFDKHFKALGACIEEAQNDKSLEPAKRAELIELYERWTVEMAKAMAEVGRGDPKYVRSQLDQQKCLDRVRHRADFQQLYREVSSRCGDGKP